MRRIASLLVLLSLALCLSAPARAERRMALVIGNGAYKVGPLKNPANDARDMAAALRAVGFEVILRENAGLRQMNEAIDQFWTGLKKGGVGLFFFAGHGVQVGGENFLVPVDAKIALEKDVQYECVNAGKVLGRMEDAGNGLNIVILDACRNNPFARSFRSDSRGLAKMDAPTGSLVAFATAPGDIAADGEGKNGLYTGHLLRHLRTPGLTIENVLKQTRIGVAAESAKMGKKQTPWESSSLMGDFYFAGGAGQAPPQPVAAAPAPVQPAPMPAAPAPVIQTASLPPAQAGGRFDRIPPQAAPQPAAQPTAQAQGQGGAPRAWLGIKMATLTPEAAKSLGIANASGALVQEILPNSPAAALDIKPGDVIIAAGGEMLRDADTLRRKVAAAAPGSALGLRYLRQGQQRDVLALLTAPPAEQAQAPAVQPPAGEVTGQVANAIASARMDQLNRRRADVAAQAAPAVAPGELSGLTVRLIYTDDMRSSAEVVQARLRDQGMTVEMLAFKKNDSYHGHIGKLYSATGYEAAAERIAGIVRAYTPITIIPGGPMTDSRQRFNLWIAR